MNQRTKAIIQALFEVFLWATVITGHVCLAGYDAITAWAMIR